MPRNSHIAEPFRSVLPSPTHCFELYRIIKKATTGQIDFADCHFTADGFCAYLTDPFDGQRYRLTLTPIKEGR